MFHHDEKVTRLVTQSELTDTYNLELSVQMALKRLGKSTSLSCSFVKQIPTKVLQSIGLKVVEILNEVPAVDDTMLVSSDQTILHSNKVQVSSGGSVSVDSSGNRSMVGEVLGDTPGIPATIFDVNIRRDQEPDGDYSIPEDAAKPDDADAEASEWDEWIATSFVHTSIKERAWSVCSGTYDKKNHGRLFDAMQALLIRRYRRNVTRSLIKFLRKEHGTRFIRVPVGDTVSKRLSVGTWVDRHQSSSARTLLGTQRELIRELEVGQDAIRRAENSTWWNWDAGSTHYFWRWPRRCRLAVRDGTKLFVNKSKLPRYMKRQQWPSDDAQRNKLTDVQSAKCTEQGIHPAWIWENLDRAPLSHQGNI